MNELAPFRLESWVVEQTRPAAPWCVRRYAVTPDGRRFVQADRGWFWQRENAERAAAMAALEGDEDD